VTLTEEKVAEALALSESGSWTQQQLALSTAIAGWAIAPWKGAFLVALAQCIAYGGSSEELPGVINQLATSDCSSASVTSW
jgi:hypothetical protein